MNTFTSVSPLRTLRGKFLSINIPIALFSTLVLFALFELYNYRTGLAELHRSLEELVGRQSTELSHPLSNRDQAQIDLSLAAIQSHPDILGVRLLGHSGDILNQTGSFDASDGKQAAIVGRDITAQKEGQQNAIGRLEVSMTEERATKAILEQVVFACGIAFLVVGSVFFSALVAHRRTIGVPLDRLLTSIKLAQNENRRERVEWESDDEMGSVVAAFNEMQTRQEAYEADLKHARDNLERRVDERTGELASARDEAMRARTQLTEAMESIDQGFSLYGPDDFLLVSNSKYQDLFYSGIQEHFEPGTPFEMVVRRAAESGLVTEAEGRVDDWVAKRVAMHRDPQGPHSQRWTDGRWIQINERKTADGGTVAVYTDISELKRREDELADLVGELEVASGEATKARTQLIEAVESIDQGFSLYGPDDRLQLSNSKYQDLFYSGIQEHFEPGTTFEMIIRRAAESGLIKEAEGQVDDWVAKRVAKHHDPQGPHSQQWNDGRWIQINERNTAEGGTVAVYTDISELKRREDELAKLVGALEEARTDAESANEAKSAFLATMSHEIRTPMNAVVGMTSLLLNTEQTPDQREYTEVVRNSSDALLNIINDILDFSKIEAGKLDIEEQAFDLRQCVESALELIVAKASDKGLELAYRVQESVPSSIKGDVTRLRQILVNLLSNAVKFTEQGEIVVSTDAKPVEDSSRTSSSPVYQIHFAVTDTGIGIPPERLDRLFHAFSQVDASTARRYGGTGLGLAISERLSKLMGGSMWVESEKGQGSTFHFTMQAESAASTSRDYLYEVEPRLEGKRLLIVDDNATNRRILVEHGKFWGMHSRDTEFPSKALSWIRQGETFDIAILDMHMPDMDGVMLATEIQKIRDPKTLPLVMLTSLGERPGGMDKVTFAAFLQKPIKPSQLFDALVSVFAGQSMRIESSVTSPNPMFDAQMGERLPLRILLAEDNVTNQKLGLRLLEQLGYRADVAGNGLEVLQALRRQSYDVVLMDVQMPEMDGLEATRCVRREKLGGTELRIIAMTANAMEGDRELCLSAGMDDYVSKPIRVKELTDALTRSHAALTNKDATSDMSECESSKEPGRVHRVLDRKQLDELEATVGGQAFLGELIDAFLEDGPNLLADLRRGLDQADASLLMRAAHSLKSNSADFGAANLSDLSKQIEAMGKTGALDGTASLVAEIETEFERVHVALQSVKASAGIDAMASERSAVSI
ncbi:MAG: response regulator [Gammaproteobacteria bacterium]